MATAGSSVCLPASLAFRFGESFALVESLAVVSAAGLQAVSEKNTPAAPAGVTRSPAMGGSDHIFSAGIALHICNDNSPAAEFERWLFVHGASVLLADKAGELIAFPIGTCGMNAQNLATRLSELGARWQVETMILHTTESTVKFILYRSDRVREQLRNTPPCSLCDSLGYCAGVEPNAFLHEVARRWQRTGEIPHEVGLALGYPVKDVLGFMGHNDLPCTVQCGWRVYGNPAPSLEANKRYHSARVQAMKHVALLCARV